MASIIESDEGDVRLLQHKETKKVRIILRQKKTLKIRMNHQVHPSTDLRANSGSDRAWTWVATDFSDEVAKIETFAIRFKDSNVANEFKEAFDMAKRINASMLPLIPSTDGDEKKQSAHATFASSSSSSGSSSTGSHSSDDKSDIEAMELMVGLSRSKQETKMCASSNSSSTCVSSATTISSSTVTSVASAPAPTPNTVASSTLSTSTSLSSEVASSPV